MWFLEAQERRRPAFGLAHGSRQTEERKNETGLLRAAPGVAGLPWATYMPHLMALLSLLAVLGV